MAEAKNHLTADVIFRYKTDSFTVGTASRGVEHTKQLMKKIVASVGLVALGATSLNAVYGQGMAATAYKPWSISASLRGFYDDNINTVPSSSSFHQSSFGFQVDPAVNLSWQNDQTMLQANYDYTLRWYDKRPYSSSSHYDQDHTFNLGFNHAFTERYRLGINDSFVIGQEPDLLRSGYALEEPQRIPGDNIRNYGTINFDAEITPLFGLEVGYANSFFHYHDEGPFSLAASLDRIQNLAHLDGRIQLMPQTVGVIGYQYSQEQYTGNNVIGLVPSGPFAFTLVYSRVRDNRAHYGYVGADHNFLPDLSGSLRIGLRDTDYYNSPSGENSVSPYVMASLRYNYTTESSAEIGFNYDRNATDVTGISANTLTLDEESAVVYASVNHRIVPNLYGSLIAQFQNSTFNGGTFDGEVDRYYLIGLNFQYKFNPFLSANAGYNYDKIDSDIPGRSFDRNRVYIGLTASY